MNRNLLIFLDKSLFQIIFYFLVLLSILWKQKKTNYYPGVDKSQNFLIIRPGGLGDGFMSIPLLKALRENFPDNRISLLCVQKNKAVLQQLPFFDEIIVIDRLRNLHKSIFKLIGNQYDVVFDLEPFRKASAVIAYLSRANIRIGFDTNDRRLLYTHYISYANEKCYESLNMVRQLKVLDVNVPENEAVDMTIPLTQEDSAKARTMLKLHGIRPGKDFIVAIVPGVLKKHHRWIMTRFASLIQLILKGDNRVKILLLGTPSDIADAQEVLQDISDKKRVANLVGRTNFSGVLGILTFCKILIACDGGIVYMAAAMGCSTISIWGPGVMERFKPPGDNHIGVRKNYFCVPCVNYMRLGEFPKCPYDRKCITDISVDDVFYRYMELKKKLLPDKKHLSAHKVI